MAPPEQRTVVPMPHSSVVPKQPGCSIKILAEAPSEGARALGTIHLIGHVPAEAEVIRQLEQKACEIGADAIFVRKIEQQSAAGQIDFEVTASAYALESGGASSVPGGKSAGEP